MMRRVLACLLSLPLLVLSPALAGGASRAPRPPSSMAAIGDSMTQAADVCCW